jgi:CBS domain containing-hemolysin-like protein
LEELVGEIYDEHDEIEILFRPIDDKNFIVSGDENVEEMFEKLSLNIPEDISATTVSGFVIELMDKIPVVGEVLALEKLQIEVTKANTKHVQEVKVTLVDEEVEEEQ